MLRAYTDHGPDGLHALTGELDPYQGQAITTALLTVLVRTHRHDDETALDAWADAVLAHAEPLPPAWLSLLGRGLLGVCAHWPFLLFAGGVVCVLAGVGWFGPTFTLVASLVALLGLTLCLLGGYLDPDHDRDREDDFRALMSVLFAGGFALRLLFIGGVSLLNLAPGLAVPRAPFAVGVIMAAAGGVGVMVLRNRRGSGPTALRVVLMMVSLVLLSAGLLLALKAWI